MTGSKGKVRVYLGLAIIRPVEKCRVLEFAAFWKCEDEPLTEMAGARGCGSYTATSLARAIAQHRCLTSLILAPRCRVRTLFIYFRFL